MAKSALYTRCFGHRFSLHPHLKWNLIIVYDLWFTSLNWVKINLSISFLIQSRYSGSCKSPLTRGQGMQSLVTYAIAPLMDYYERSQLPGSKRGSSVSGHRGGQGLPGGQEQWGLPGVAGPSSQRPSHHPSQEQGRWGQPRGLTWGPGLWAGRGGWENSEDGWAGLLEPMMPSGPWHWYYQRSLSTVQLLVFSLLMNISQEHRN